MFYGIHGTSVLKHQCNKYSEVNTKLFLCRGEEKLPFLLGSNGFGKLSASSCVIGTLAKPCKGAGQSSHLFAKGRGSTVASLVSPPPPLKKKNRV